MKKERQRKEKMEKRRNSPLCLSSSLKNKTGSWRLELDFLFNMIIIIISYFSVMSIFVLLTHLR